MKTQEIATRLAAYCRKRDWEGAQKELYAQHAKSIEAYATPSFEKETVGLDAIIAKGHKFNAMIEKMHSIEVSEPLVARNSLAFVINMDVTMKGQERMSAPELCLYKVESGKIISEEFFV